MTIIEKKCRAFSRALNIAMGFSGVTHPGKAAIIRKRLVQLEVKRMKKRVVVSGNLLEPLANANSVI